MHGARRRRGPRRSTSTISARSPARYLLVGAHRLVRRRRRGDDGARPTSPTSAVTIGEIDPDPFYDFTQERPDVEIDGGDVREIRWPANRSGSSAPAARNDLVVLAGVEPHLAWRTYAALHPARRRTARLRGRRDARGDRAMPSRTPACRRSSAAPRRPTLARRLGPLDPDVPGHHRPDRRAPRRARAGRRADGLAARRRTALPRPRRAPARRQRPAPPPRPRPRHAARRRPARQIDRWSTLHDEAVTDDDRLAGLRPHARGRLRPPDRGEHHGV